MPNLFCHVTFVIGWHVINSLAYAVGCHLLGNKSLLLTVGGEAIQYCVLSFSKYLSLTPYQLPCPQPVWSKRPNWPSHMGANVD